MAAICCTWAAIHQVRRTSGSDQGTQVTPWAVDDQFSGGWRALPCTAAANLTAAILIVGRRGADVGATGAQHRRQLVLAGLASRAGEAQRRKGPSVQPDPGRQMIRVGTYGHSWLDSMEHPSY